jgi:hypothetical protein
MKTVGSVGSAKVLCCRVSNSGGSLTGRGGKVLCLGFPGLTVPQLCTDPIRLQRPSAPRVPLSYSLAEE